jgi:hypothetical protein
MQICGFTICGLAHLRNLRQEFADLRFTDFKKKFACPPLFILLYSLQYVDFLCASRLAHKIYLLQTDSACLDHEKRM